MKTRVIHIKDTPSGWHTDPVFVYIGRAGKGLTGEYGNPHPVGWCTLCSCEHARGEAVAAHRADVLTQLAVNTDYRAKLEKLRGKTLVCFCKPAACHGDTYVEILERVL